jgi:phage tail-like protein
MEMPKQGERKETVNTKFKVVMQDYEEAVFNTCEGLEAEIDVVFISEGGRGNSARAVRGGPKAGKITFGNGVLSGGKSGKKSLFEWFMDVTDSSKALKRQLLTIQLLDSGNTVVKSWKVHDAWPCRWTGPLLALNSSELVVEHVSFAYEGISN